MNTRFSRRHFMGSAVAALGAAGLRPRSALGLTLPPPPKGLGPVDPYDDLAKLSSNENPYGPSEKMMASMNAAWKYSNRYGYPDGDVLEKIAEHHGVDTDHIIMHAGSGETLKVAALAFLRHEEKVVGVEPTFLTVYRAASGVDADAIIRPLLSDHTQDIATTAMSAWSTSATPTTRPAWSSPIRTSGTSSTTFPRTSRS